MTIISQSYGFALNFFLTIVRILRKIKEKTILGRAILIKSLFFLAKINKVFTSNLTKKKCYNVGYMIMEFMKGVLAGFYPVYTYEI